MAALKLAHSLFSRKSGCLVLSGFGIKLRCNAGHLSIEDGIADERRTIRVAKIARDLKRIIVIGSDGFATFEALRWIADIGASLIFLDRRGKVLFVSGPTAPSDARLRRAQSLALGNGTALRVSKELIAQKLDGQATLVRDMLHNPVAADAILRFKADLAAAQSIDSVRIIEAQAAKAYWSAWADVPIRWPRKDERKKLPAHWTLFGSRISQITHSPRLATNPPNSLLNLIYSILEAESRIALVAMGLDPGIGLGLHVDSPSRDSLIFDCMEPIRTKCDAFVLHWLQTELFRKSDWWESRDGNCRLGSSLAIKLCQTADVWRRFCAPVAEFVAGELWNSVSRAPSTRAMATRLTQSTKRSVKGSEVPAVTMPKPEHGCAGCGAKIPRDKRRTLCGNCGRRITIKNFRVGRKMAHTPESRARRAVAQSKQQALNREFDPATLPAWFTRDFYLSKIGPALAKVPRPYIREATGVSEPHAARIQSGIVPHARHWPKLATLAGVSSHPA